MMAKRIKTNDSNRVGRVMYWFYLCILLLSLVILGRVVYLQFFWKPDPEISRRLTQPVRKMVIEPRRGSILADDGRPLAM